MKLINQEPHCSTLMSSVKAAYKYYYNEDITDGMLFGLSGHAFAINITIGLGPCAPYTFDMSYLDKLCKSNLGLSLFNDGTVVIADTSDELKKKATEDIKKYLDHGNIILMSSYEFQLIVGYEDNHFIITKPWNDAPSVTHDIEMYTFNGIKDFLNYTVIKKSEQSDFKEGVLKSIEYARSLFKKPKTTPDSAEGLKAYEFWLSKMTEENAVGHGNWWTSNVWSESRKFAVEYFNELRDLFNNSKLIDEITRKYSISSNLLKDISNKEVEMKQKVSLINDLKANELEIEEILGKLHTML